jgi:predicted nucleic acid-binding Zn ribbon protein
VKRDHVDTLLWVGLWMLVMVVLWLAINGEQL